MAKNKKIIKRYAKEYLKEKEYFSKIVDRLSESLTKEINDGFIYEFWSNEAGWLVGRYKDGKYENRESVLYDTEIENKEKIYEN